jgi:hypothetical protein
MGFVSFLCCVQGDGRGFTNDCHMAFGDSFMGPVIFCPVLLQTVANPRFGRTSLLHSYHPRKSLRPTAHSC